MSKSAEPSVDAFPAATVVKGHAQPAAGAEGLSAVDEQNRLLAIAETRLADEVRWLGRALAEFGFRTKAIREEIPSSAQFCKLIAGFFPMTAFQLAIALGERTGSFTFEDDGALYLKKLGLEVNDFVREVDLEGRKFLAVAFLDHRGRNVLDGSPKGDEL